MKKIFLLLVWLSSLLFASFKTDSIDNVIGKDIQILDVRTPSEWKEGVLKGAILVSLTDENMHIDPNFVNLAKQKLDPNKPVAVICRSGNRSAIAADLLDRAGVENVINIAGGMKSIDKTKFQIVNP